LTLQGWLEGYDVEAAHVQSHLPSGRRHWHAVIHAAPQHALRSQDMACARLLNVSRLGGPVSLRESAASCSAPFLLSLLHVSHRHESAASCSAPFLLSLLLDVSHLHGVRVSPL